MCGFKILLTKPTHISESSPSCVDLIFINQPDIVIDSGMYQTLPSKCHHFIVYLKLNAKMEYPCAYACGNSGL